MSARRKRDQRRSRPEGRESRRKVERPPSTPGKPAAPSSQRGGQISVRQVPGEKAWELVHPASVLRRQEDMEEIRAMLAAGEIDVAVDELRWLLSGCRALLEAQKLLGEIALAENDLPLAQAHLGYAYEMGLAAIRGEKDFTGPLAYALAANQPFLEAGKGLAWCLQQQGDARSAAGVIRQLLELDPSDPFGLKQLHK
jgi:tetratricopeptide (TPR) repeat protein